MFFTIRVHLLTNLQHERVKVSVLAIGYERCEMNKQEAIEYLERKGKIEGKKLYNKTEKKEIETAMKEGKLYGDPVCEVTY